MGVFVRTQRLRPHLSADYASMAINFPFWGSKVNLNFTLFHRRLAYGLIYTGPPFPLWERKLSFTLIWGTQFSTYILHLWITQRITGQERLDRRGFSVPRCKAGATDSE